MEKCSAFKSLLFIEYTCLDIQNLIWSLQTWICQYLNLQSKNLTHPAISSYRDSKVEMSIERSPSGPRLLATKITGSRGAQVPKMEVQASLHWEEWRVGQYEVNLQYTHGVIWNRSLTQSHSTKCAHMHLPEYHSCFRMFALPSSFFLSMLVYIHAVPLWVVTRSDGTT